MSRYDITCPDKVLHVQAVKKSTTSPSHETVTQIRPRNSNKSPANKTVKRVLSYDTIIQVQPMM